MNSTTTLPNPRGFVPALTPSTTLPDLQRERRDLKHRLAFAAQLAADAFSATYGVEAVAMFSGNIEGVTNAGRELRVQAPSGVSGIAVDDAVAEFSGLLAECFGPAAGEVRVSVTQDGGVFHAASIMGDAENRWDDFPQVLVIARGAVGTLPKRCLAKPPKGYVREVCGGVR